MGITRITGIVLIVSSALASAGLYVKTMYDAHKLNDSVNEIRLLRDYSEKPDEAKLAELRQTQEDSHQAISDSLLLFGTASGACFIGGALCYVNRTRREENPAEIQTV